MILKIFVSVVLLTYKIVILSRLELKPTRLRGEGAEGNGEVHELVGLVTDSNHTQHTDYIQLLSHSPWLKIRQG